MDWMDWMVSRHTHIIASNRASWHLSSLSYLSYGSTSLADAPTHTHTHTHSLTSLTSLTSLILVAAVCGLTAGLVEYASGHVGEPGPVILDTLVGVATGVVGSLFHRYVGGCCLSAIFLGTEYWFFYGTAFVIGLLEIIAGELETGVTRFIAVSVKTFVLCLGASIGMMLTLDDTAKSWQESHANCNSIDLDQHWWRIPLYLLCSASALAQYRFPIVDYWRGLAVQVRCTYQLGSRNIHTEYMWKKDAPIGTLTPSDPHLSPFTLNPGLCPVFSLLSLSCSS